MVTFSMKWWKTKLTSFWAAPARMHGIHRGEEEFVGVKIVGWKHG